MGVARTKILECARVIMLALLAAGVSCDSANPSAPNRGFTIVPDTKSLRVTETVQFSAMSDGNVVAPAWSSSAPNVVTVSQTGSATGVAVGSAVITADAGSMSASRTMQVVSDYRGQYSGTAIITRCVRLSGSGPASSCVVGARFAINVLTLDQQTGTAVTGTLNLFAESTIGAVTGTVDENDHISSMSGTLRSSGEDAVVVTIERWDTVLAGDRRQLNGSFGVDMQFQNGFGPQHQDIDFSFSDVVRQ